MSNSKEAQPQSTMTASLNQSMDPKSEVEFGPQRRKRMPAGRHLDAVKPVSKPASEPPKAPLRISEQLQAQLKNPELPKLQSKGSEQTDKGGLKGEIQVK